MDNKDLLKKDYTISELAQIICFGKPLHIFILLTVTALLLRIYYLVLTGVRTPDITGNYDSGFFVSGAKLLLSSPGEYLKKFIKMPFYMGYTCAVAGIYAVSAQSNAAVCVVQILFSSVCPFLMWRICENFFNDRRVSLICGLIMAVLPMNYRWDSQVTSDSFGMFSSVLCLFAFSVYYTAEKGNRRREVILLLLSLLGFFLMRTTAGTIIAVILVYMVMQLPSKKRAVIWAGVTAVCAAAVIFILNGDGVHSLGGNLNYFSELFRDGEVIRDIYYYDMKRDLSDLFGIIFYRILFFFCPYDIGVGIKGGRRLSYQLLHYLPIIPLFIFAFVGAVRGIAEKKSIVKFFLWVIILSSLVQAVTEIQYDLRYRDPVLPYFYMLAACEIIEFADSIKKKKDNIARMEE